MPRGSCPETTCGRRRCRCRYPGPRTGGTPCRAGPSGNARHSSSRFSSWFDPDEERLDEPGVGLEHGDRSRRGCADAGQEPRLGRRRRGRDRAGTVETSAKPSPGRGSVPARPRKDIDERTGRRIGQLPGQADGDHRGQPPRNRRRGSVWAISDWPTVPMPRAWKSGGGDPTMTSASATWSTATASRWTVGGSVIRSAGCTRLEEVEHAVPRRPVLLTQVAGLLECAARRRRPACRSARPTQPRMRVRGDRRRCRCGPG